MSMKRSEKILLGVFAVLFVLIVGGGLVLFGVKRYREIVTENERLEFRLEEIHHALAEARSWQEKADWIDAHVPALASRQEASSRLLDLLQKDAAALGIQLTGKEFVERRPVANTDEAESESEGGYFDQATVRVNVLEVKEKALYQWLHSINKAENFLGVTRMVVSPTGQSRTVNCELELTQFYRAKNPQKISSAP